GCLLTPHAACLSAARNYHLCRNSARFRRFVLNAPLSSVIGPVNDPVSACGYTRAMMIKPVLTILATAVIGAAGTSLALAQPYPQSPGAAYSRDPNYPSGGYPADYRDPRAVAPEYDALEDEQ